MLPERALELLVLVGVSGLDCCLGYTGVLGAELELEARLRLAILFFCNGMEGELGEERE